MARPTFIAAAVAVTGAITWLYVRHRRRRSPWALVICAVSEEAIFVEAELSNAATLTLSGTVAGNTKVLRGQIGGIRVDVVTCGIGSVDAAMVTTAALLEAPCPPIAVLSVGCAGAHADFTKSGDVVLGSAAVPTAYKMVREDGRPEHVGLRFTTSDEPMADLPASGRLLDVAKTAAASMDLPAWPTTPKRRPMVHTGKICSSDIWTQQPAEIHRMHTELGTLCEEMEAFSVARVCMAMGSGGGGVPWLAIKDVVNSELEPVEGAAEETGLGESILLGEVGKRAAMIAVATLRRLAAMHWNRSDAP